ncbi:MAG: chromate transporter [Betaproteobacteria bacterium]|nr:chromate transporter [Betaproteobacteria bacterium]
MAAPGLPALFLGFLEIALSGFGGVLPWARRVLVEQRRWLSADEFTDLSSLCQFLPGPKIVNMSVAVGARFRGASGALAAFFGLMLAPVAIILTLGALYSAYGQLPQVQALVRGISAVASGLLIATGLKMLVAPRVRSWLLCFAALAFLGVALLRLPLLASLLVLAPAAIAAAWWRQQRAPRAPREA